ncbi:importin [Ecytonucleospora hepatopenaei]|uniref:Importin n=1 Tax=Ecytonucleospora hepatopenaei TaxID=646526 RepID=A0A1W0E5R5_9MICR|nr:importin [Ecytonucleospora hepatopenaei]
MNSEQQKLRSLIVDTLNSDTNIRNAAEQQLNTCVKNVEILKCIHENLIRDENFMVCKASGIFLVNKLREIYEENEIQQFILFFEQHVFEHLVYAKTQNELDVYKKLLCVFFEKAKEEKVKFILHQVGASFTQKEHEKIRAGLIALNVFFDSEVYGSVLVQSIKACFSSYGNAFAEVVQMSTQSNNYEFQKLIFEILHKIYDMYNIPTELCEISVFNFYIEQALLVVRGMEYKNLEFVCAKKWAYVFLQNATKKGIKKFFKSSELNKHVQNENFILGVANVFSSVIDEFKNNNTPEEDFLVSAAQFFEVLCSKNDETKTIFKNYLQKVVYEFVIPCFKYDEQTEALFEADPTAYLNERYNFSTKQLRANISQLFYSIVKYNKTFEGPLIELLIQLLNDNNTQMEIKYGALGLLSEVSSQTQKVMGEEGYYTFLVNLIQKILASGNLYMASQLFLYMSLCPELNLKKNDFEVLLKEVFRYAQHENIALKVESTLAIQFFFASEDCISQIHAFVPGLLETVLKYNRLYPSEALSSFLEYIVECFDDVMVDFAPRFVTTIIGAINDLLKEGEVDYYQTSTYITTVDKFVQAASDRSNILNNLYEISVGVIYMIIKNEHFDLFSETIALMNSFLFAMEKVDDRAYEIFKAVISTDSDELCMYIEEIEMFMDNYVSFGGDAMINSEVLAAFNKVFDMFFICDDVEDGGFYSRDVIAACNIINALLCYRGSLVKSCQGNFIPNIVNKVLGMFSNIMDDSIPCIVNVLDLLMNCIVVDTANCLSVIGDYKAKFYAKIWENSYNFIRVIDKKIYLLFINAIFTLPVDGSIDMQEMNKSFVHVFGTLPGAIQKRNKMMDGEYDDEDEEKENDDDFYDSDDSKLHEDIYTYSEYDKIDVYSLVKNMLSNVVPGTVGQNLLSSMQQQQISVIQKILCNPQEQQKLK